MKYFAPDPDSPEVDRPQLIPLYGVGYAGGLLLIVWLATLSPLFLVPALIIPVAAAAVHAQRCENRLGHALDQAEGHIRSWPPVPSIDALLERDPRDLRGRIAKIRTYANPEYRGSVRFGTMVSVYHTVAIDHDGGVHPIDSSEQFEDLEERARAAADRVGVPFESLI